MATTQEAITASASNLMDDMNALVADTNRTMFFPDVPCGALKQKPPTTRKAATSFTEALTNLGTDIQNTLLFNDLASYARDNACGGFKQGKNYDKTPGLVAADDGSVASSDKQSVSSNEMDKSGELDKSGSLGSFEGREGDNPDDDEVLHAVGSFVDGVAKTHDEVMDGVTRVGSLVADTAAPHCSAAIGEMARAGSCVASNAPQVHDDVIDHVNDFIDHVADGVGELAYEIADTARFTKEELMAAGKEIKESTAVRYTSNVMGIQHYEFVHKNAEMKDAVKDRARLGFVPYSRVYADKDGNLIPIPYPETGQLKETKVETECRGKTVAPPALKRIKKQDAARRKARKEAELKLAYEKSLTKEAEKVREHYKEAVLDEMNSYEQLVNPAGGGRRRRRSGWFW